MINRGYAHFADALVFAHGRYAAAEAARQALLNEKIGDNEMALYWRKLQTQLTLTLDKPDLRKVA